MLRILCSPSFLLKTPARFKRLRMYWPHRHLPCVIMSCAGICGLLQPIVLDSFRVTTSLTLLSRRRAEIEFAAAISDPRRLAECNEAGKLNLRRLIRRLLGRSRSRRRLGGVAVFEEAGGGEGVVSLGFI